MGVFMAMTPKKYRFIDEYMTTRNAAEAYRRAYCPGENASSVHQRAYDLRKEPGIAAIILQREGELRETAKVKAADLALHLLKIAFHDPNELAGVRMVACEHCHGEDHRKQWREPDFIDACKAAERGEEPFPDIGGGFGYSTNRAPHPNCPKCDGKGEARSFVADTAGLSDSARAAFQGIRQTKYGPEVVSADRLRALELVSKMLGFDKMEIGLTTDLAKLAAALKLETSDPTEASRVYAKIMQGN